MNEIYENFFRNLSGFQVFQEVLLSVMSRVFL